MGEDVVPTIVLSGGFDPIHSGHLAMIKDAEAYGDVHIFLNTDEWLLRKKGFIFMPWDERAEVLRSIKGVDSVWMAKDTDNTVKESLKEYQNSIDYFGNGGDRKETNSPETDFCYETENITPVFGLGGEKTNSSSSLISNALNRANVKRKWGSYQTVCIRETESSLHKKVKLLFVEGFLSKQTHQKRHETWLLVDGDIETHEGKMIPGKAVMINAGDMHWMEGKGIVLEIQTGSYLGEDDIERFK
tara:strand:- start:6867 stop:7601 length:735 start_codon:yes stop_codon:yes gene_type:complete